MGMNVGGIDRVVRIVAGICLLGLVFVLEGSARWLGLVGIVPLATGLIGYCPLYSVVGVNTCPSAAKRA